MEPFKFGLILACSLVVAIFVFIMTYTRFSKKEKISEQEESLPNPSSVYTQAIDDFIIKVAKSDPNVIAYMRNIPNKEKIYSAVIRLDENPDKLHSDITPAVLELGQMEFGQMMPFLVDALKSKDEMTRLHAQRALEFSYLKERGFVQGKGWTKPKGEEVYKATWKANGSYTYNAPKKQRDACVDKWLNEVVVID